MRKTQKQDAYPQADRQYGEQPHNHNWDSYGSFSTEARGEDRHSGATDLTQAAYRFWQDLPEHDDVLFYPIADLDQTPLRRASHLADVFLLCDWRWPYSPSEFDATINRLFNADDTPGGLELFTQQAGQCSFDVLPEQVHAVTGVSDDFGLFHEPAWVAGQQPWCRITRLKRRNCQVERPVWLAYLVGDAVEVYQNLFVKRRAAPKVLWLECGLGADVNRWTNFISHSGEFGHVFSTAAQQPKYVAAQRRHPGWQQSVVCQRLSSWHHAWDLILYGFPDTQKGADEGGQERW